MTTPEAAQLEAIDWRELLRAARSLLQPDNGASPSDECIRRAISNAYYAMFHALAASNADVIVGPPHDDLTAEAWIRVYRGLDHSTASRRGQKVVPSSSRSHFHRSPTLVTHVAETARTPNNPRGLASLKRKSENATGHSQLRGVSSARNWACVHTAPIKP